MRVKRPFDLLATAVGGLLISPFVAVLAVLVRWGLGSPVLFRQLRPGLHTDPFDLVKFRTMTDERDTDGQLPPDEPRLTRFGRTLRSTSLDELPKLWNVLRGDMSLVGRRPLLMAYLPTTRHGRHGATRSVPGPPDGCRSTAATARVGIGGSNWTSGTSSTGSCGWPCASWH